MSKEVTKLSPDFNCDPEELEQQQEMIKNIESLINDPIKFVEQYIGVKLHWYQKLWITLNLKFDHKKHDLASRKGRARWDRRRIRGWK